MRVNMIQVAIAFDQLINTLFGGYADETLSARIHRNQSNSLWWKMWRNIINSVFFWQKDHCYESYLSEQNRNHLPKIYRNKV